MGEHRVRRVMEGDPLAVVLLKLFCLADLPTQLLRFYFLLPPAEYEGQALAHCRSYSITRGPIMSCEGERAGEARPEGGTLEKITFEKIKAHAKEFMEATPEEHKK